MDFQSALGRGRMSERPKSLRLRIRAVTLAFGAFLALASVSCKKPAASTPPAVPEVVVAQVVQRDVPLYHEWVGTTEGFVNAEIHPKITGYLLKQVYKDGQHVQAGQLLFLIDDREYKAALNRALADLAEKQAQYKKNAQDLARYKPLLDERVIGQQDFDHVNQATQASAATVQAAQAIVETAKLNEDWTRITSPIEGIAGIAKTQVGNLVSPTTELTMVSQLNPIKVEFPISEREYLHFADKIKGREEGTRTGPPYIDMILADGSTYKYPGQFYVANRQVNIDTGTIKLQALFPNPDDVLRPGLYAKLRSAVETQQSALPGAPKRGSRNPGTVPGRGGKSRQKNCHDRGDSRKQFGDLRVITRG